MKNFQQNLLIVLALGLCALCAWQWTDQTHERRAILERNQMVYDRDKAIQGYTNSLAAGDKQIAELQSSIARLNNDSAATEEKIRSTERQRIEWLGQMLEFSNQAVHLAAAITNLETKLNTAYDGIAKQNDAVKELVAQRDDFIAKYTNSVNARNDIVLKYNDLVERVSRMQSNAPPKQ
jgi:chromosome segregation ATPase